METRVRLGVDRKALGHEPCIGADQEADEEMRYRWSKILDPSLTRGPWSEEEDKCILALQREHWELVDEDRRASS